MRHLVIGGIRGVLGTLFVLIVADLQPLATIGAVTLLLLISALDTVAHVVQDHA